jgi:pyruvate/2-oxoglutarate dehydrogenase complex dihydrolipoamide dehydrogenase (E3) component
VAPYADLDRGIIDGRPGGSCKLIVSRATRRILGAHNIVGEHALEMVQIAATAMRAGMCVEQLADLELAYPTFTAVVGLAARRITRTLGLVPLAPVGHEGSERLRAAEWELRSG